MPSSVAGSLRAARVADDPVPHRRGQVQAEAVALERVDHAQRVLVVHERQAEALGQAAVERVLAHVAEGRVAEVVAEPDRLGQVLVEASARATVREICVTSSVCVSRVR